MPLLFRIILILVSLGSLTIVLWKVRRAQAQVSTAVFWITFALILVIVSIFPGMVIFISNLLGIDSPANFVFLCVLFVMIFKLFFMSLQLSKIQYQLQQLAQRTALDDAKNVSKNISKNYSVIVTSENKATEEYNDDH